MKKRVAIVIAVVGAIGVALALFWPRFARGEENDVHLTVWTRPIGTLVMAGNGDVHVSLGAEIPTGGWPLVVDLTFSRAGWYGCSSVQTGGWGSVGWQVLSPESGWRLEPRLSMRAMYSSEGQASGWFGCSTEVVDALPGWDLEIGLRLDAGYAWNFGHLHIGLVAGAGMAVCYDCPGGGAIFSGPLGLSNKAPRASRPTLIANLDLLRVGFTF